MKVSVSQMRMLESIYKGKPYNYHCTGMSQFGAAGQTRRSLIRLGLLIDQRAAIEAAWQLGGAQAEGRLSLQLAEGPAELLSTEGRKLVEDRCVAQVKRLADLERARPRRRTRR